MKTIFCHCGSGEEAYILRDARGISCGYVCSQCEEERKSHYRADIFEDSEYWADEPIEEEDWI
jgi:hypothetical protein